MWWIRIGRRLFKKWVLLGVCLAHIGLLTEKLKHPSYFIFLTCVFSILGVLNKIPQNHRRCFCTVILSFQITIFETNEAVRLDKRHFYWEQSWPQIKSFLEIRNLVLRKLFVVLFRFVLFCFILFCFILLCFLLCFASFCFVFFVLLGSVVNSLRPWKHCFIFFFYCIHTDYRIELSRRLCWNSTFPFFFQMLW